MHGATAGKTGKDLGWALYMKTHDIRAGFSCCVSNRTWAKPDPTHGGDK